MDSCAISLKLLNPNPSEVNKVFFFFFLLLLQANKVSIKGYFEN